MTDFNMELCPIFSKMSENDIPDLAIQKRVKEVLLREYTQEQIDNPTEKQAEEMQRLVTKETMDISFELMEKKFVWFMISENYGRYYITMYYDNEYNHSDGEDL